MSLKVNVLISWLAHAVTLGIGFFLMPYILHTVGDNTYGTWLFLNSIAGQTGLLYLGFGDAVSRFTAKYHTEKQWVQLNRTVSCITSVYFSSALLALLAGCGVAVAAPWLSDWQGQSLREVQLVIVLLGLNAAISIAGSAFGGVLMGIQRFDIERSIIIAVGLIRLTMTLLFLKAQFGLLTLALIFLGVTVVENLLTCLMAFRCVPHLQLRFRHLRKSVYQKCFSFSLFTFLSLISEHVIYMLDTILIGFFLGPMAVVPYYIAARLTEMIRIPLLQIGHVFLPRAGELQALQQAERLRSLVCQGIGISFLLAASALIGGIYFGDLMIRTWIGEGYLASSWILIVLMAGQVVALPTHLLRNVLTGTGFVRAPALLFLLTAVLNLVISLALLPWWGIYGVAVGTLIPLAAVEFGLMLPLGLKQLQISFPQLLRIGIRPQLIPLCLILIYSMLLGQMDLQPNWLQIVAIVAGAVCVLLAGLGLSLWNQKWKLNPTPVEQSALSGGLST